MRVGDGCSFYHEGGRGERYWAAGWRYGIVRAIPVKGVRKGWVKLEIPVRRYGFDVVRLEWTPRVNETAWVHAANINAVGDFIYHGLSAVEAFKARNTVKAEQQNKADKKRRKAT